MVAPISVSPVAASVTVPLTVWALSHSGTMRSSVISNRFFILLSS